ncbi:MAG: hypothetical protein SGPRY_004714 [Prymnesium sp.]
MLCTSVIVPIVWPIAFLLFSKAVLSVYILYLFFYMLAVASGLRRIWCAEREALPVREVQSPLYYAFIIPNYMEDLAVLECTLSNLASHPYAKMQYIIVLAMEGREAASHLKARELEERYSESFLLISHSVHKLDVNSKLHTPPTTECPGKASNSTFGAVHLSDLCSQRGYSPSDVIVTIMDADTLLSSRYVIRLDRMLLEWRAGDRLHLVTQQMFVPYMAFSNLDDPSVPYITKVNDLLWGLSLLMHMTRPTPIRFPVSTYSMSLQLLKAVGYWETGDAGIGEDAHTALKVFFATDGEARTVPIYEAFRCQDSVSRLVRSQAKRHALGHIDFGYGLWKAWNTPSMPKSLRFIATLQAAEVLFWMLPLPLFPDVVLDPLFAAGIMIGWGSGLAEFTRTVASHTNPFFCPQGGIVAALACYPDLNHFPERLSMVTPSLDAVSFCIWLLVTICQVLSAEWLSAHHLVRGSRQWVGGLLKWLLLPVAMVTLFVAPSLDAHVKLFKKVRLTYSVAPKTTNSTPSLGIPKNAFVSLASLPTYGGTSTLSVSLLRNESKSCAIVVPPNDSPRLYGSKISIDSRLDYIRSALPANARPSLSRQSGNEGAAASKESPFDWRRLRTDLSFTEEPNQAEAAWQRSYAHELEVVA